MQKRQTKYEMIRVVAMLLMIMDHTIVHTSDLEYWIVNPVLMLCNPLFFMLSGKFALIEQFNCAKDIVAFYKKKVINLCIPVLIYMIIKSFIEIAIEIHGGKMSLEIGNIFYIICNNILGNGFKAMDYWFIYVLFGFLLLVPFLSNIFQKLSVRSFSILILICIGFNLLKLYLPFVGIELALKFPFGEWFVYFILGVYLERLKPVNQPFKLYLIGGISCILLNVFLQYKNVSDGVCSYAPTTILIASVCYLLFTKYVLIKNKFLEQIILFLGKHSFSIYLVHIYCTVVAERTIMMLLNVAIVNWFFVYLLTIIISIVISACIDACFVKPIQRLGIRCLHLEKEQKGTCAG